MPTASVHLAAALDLLADPALVARGRLASGQPRAAFLLGSISPDVRVISGQAREATHFYGIPLSRDRTASQTMLAAYPALAEAGVLPFDQAAFVAGYMAHLLMDEAWLELVVMPHIFIDGADWTVDHPNYRLYSLLMTYLAEQGGARLPPGVVDDLRAARPDGWLPFVTDADLLAWRERVVKYAMADSGWQTARMFAREMGCQDEALYAVVTSPTAMAREVFSAVPRGALEVFHSQTQRRCVAALNAYLPASLFAGRAGGDGS
jgi:hypothetical protein